VEQHFASTLGAFRQKNVVILEVRSDARDLSAFVFTPLQSLAVPHLICPLPNTKAVAEVPVPVPPLEEQQEIVRRVEALFKTADALEARYRTAKAHVDKLAQSILARAFRGELVTTEAELARLEGRDYEPASVLLERIRQEGAGREAPRRKSPAKSNTTKQTHAPKLF